MQPDIEVKFKIIKLGTKVFVPAFMQKSATAKCSYCKDGFSYTTDGITINKKECSICHGKQKHKTSSKYSFPYETKIKRTIINIYSNATFNDCVERDIEYNLFNMIDPENFKSINFSSLDFYSSLKECQDKCNSINTKNGWGTSIFEIKQQED